MENKDCIYQSQYAKFHMQYLYSVDISATFEVIINSNGFIGSHEFCMRNEQITENILKLKELDNLMSGYCKLIDNDSDAYICVEFTDERLKVYGQLGGSYADHFMKFEFFADQTLIKLLIGVLYAPIKI